MSAEDVVTRFWSKVDRSGGPDACWPWTAARNPNYGRFVARMRAVGAHRFAMETQVGRRLERGELVLHTCDNPPCCNPAHLFIGTQADNIRDMDRKGRRGVVNRPRGSHNPQARLSEADVRAIRRLRAEGLPLTRIASDFGVNEKSVRNVVRRHTWSHVA